MAKKSMIEREKKRQGLVAKYAVKRTALKEQFASAEGLRVAPEAFIVTLAYPATSSVKWPTKDFCLGLPSLAGKFSSTFNQKGSEDNPHSLFVMSPLIHARYRIEG
jgi:hypothetical protein